MPSKPMEFSAAFSVFRNEILSSEFQFVPNYHNGAVNKHTAPMHLLKKWRTIKCNFVVYF